MSAPFKIPASVSSKYVMGDEIARGKYGVVFKSKDKKTMNPLAVKIMLKKGNKKDDVEREVEVLRKLNHPAILQLTDFFEADKEYVLVTELLTGGELFDYVTEKDYLEEAEAMIYMKQILDGMKYLHSKNIVHLDLKPENIVLKDTSAQQLKIIDFGTAQDLTKNPNVKVMVGTPEFIAPEVLKFDPVTCAADMWAIGVITYVLLTGMSPFLGDSDMETVNSIALGEFDYPDPDPEEGYEDISQGAKDLIDALLKLNPKERLTAERCLEHPWVTKTTPSTSSRISTSRLKAFRARRKWLATIRAVRVSISLLRMVSGLGLKGKSTGSSDSDTCPITPPACPNEEVFNGK